MTKQLLIALGLLVGCARPGETATARATVSQSVAIQAPSGTRAQSVGERLQLESATRSGGDPRTEDVLLALQRAGVRIREARQHAGAPVGALYCIGGETENNVALSVCEYRDDAAARAGKELSANAFKAIQNREVWVQRGTTLTVLQSRRTSQSESEAKRAHEVFRAL